ncbi:MAG: YaeQ family protein [Pseudomonadota bacterium]
MNETDFIRLDLQIHDVDNRRAGRRVVRCSWPYGATAEDMALRVLASCSLAGERCVVPAGLRAGPRPDVAQTASCGEIARWVCIEPDAVTPVLHAARHASHVVVLYRSPERAWRWWRSAQRRLSRVSGLSVEAVSNSSTLCLASHLAPRMAAHCTLDGNARVLCLANDVVSIETHVLHDTATAAPLALRA